MVLVMRDKVEMGRNVQVFYHGHKAPKKRTEMRKKKAKLKSIKQLQKEKEMTAERRIRRRTGMS